MSDKTFPFHMSPYDTDSLLPQVSKALEKRMELVSRERYPHMWKVTDRFRAEAQEKKRSRLRTRILSVVCLAAGIFLLVPGILEPQELLVPLLVGAFATVFGILGLWGSRKKKKNPFDEAAKRILNGKDIIAEETAGIVFFSEEGMTLSSDQGNPVLVPYRDFECVVETEDLFLFVFGERVVLLQKKDLQTDAISDFQSLLTEKIAKFSFAA